MSDTLRTRVLWSLWLAGVAGWFALAILPVSTAATRGGAALLAAGVWLGLVALVWRHRRVRIALIGVTAVCAAFLVAPARERAQNDGLRDDCVVAMRRYEGVAYSWGGESPLGIDCSGLIRRGRIDAMFVRGLRTLDPGLVRGAMSLWWNDCTAQALGEERDGRTEFVVDAASVNAVDPSVVLPGDLAVTRNGVHVMAYVGDGSWIEADPGVGRVIVARVPVEGNAWFGVPVRVVRWGER